MEEGETPGEQGGVVEDRSEIVSEVYSTRRSRANCGGSYSYQGILPCLDYGNTYSIKRTDALGSDIAGIERALQQHQNEILCVISTTSCFAPRRPDSLKAIGELCSRYNALHLVNNAYGLQSGICCSLFNGVNVDCFVQSCDKNFQTPVGGAVIATFKRKKLDPIAAAYPGRASMVPARDMLLTLLHQGRNGLIGQMQMRHEMYVELRQGLQRLASELDERLLDVPENEISLAMTLERLPWGKETLLGGMLFARGVTGAR